MQHWVLSSRFFRAFALVFLLGVANYFALLSPGSLHAAAFGCRTDPIVTLSNGDVVIIAVDIAADASQITGVSYKLHVAPDVTVLNTVYLNFGSGLAESLTVVQDGKLGEYQSDTLVTAAESVAVNVRTLSQGSTNSAVGTGGQTITVKVATKANPSK